MSAAPIARYLLEFDAVDDSRPSGAGERNPGKAASVSKATLVDEAFANGFQSGSASAEAQLAEQKALHVQELAAAREAWALQEGGRLADRLAAGLGEIEARLAAVAARILEPFIATELHGRALADLVESLKVLLAQERAAAVSISGAPDLLEALRAQLEGRIENVSYLPSEACDVRVTVGQTVMETRLGTWMAKIEEAVK